MIPALVVDAMDKRIDVLSADERFEDAAVHRDRLSAFVRSSAKMQRMSSVTGCAEICAARRTEDGGWELHVIRRGRLAAAGISPRGTDPRKYLEMLRASAETVLPGIGPVAAASPEEIELVLRWLDSPGIRLVEMDGTWTCPVGGAGPPHQPPRQLALRRAPAPQRTPPQPPPARSCASQLGPAELVVGADRAAGAIDADGKFLVPAGRDHRPAQLHQVADPGIEGAAAPRPHYASAR